jgi:ABC-type polysaccharide/polyol phosphate export permease
MFQAPARKNNIGTAVSLAELIYHGTVRQLRKSHGNAIVGLVMNIVQSLIFVLGFYVMFIVLGIRGAALRGDFMLYIMSGVFLFMTHTKAMQAVAGSEGPASAMMQHSPMNTVIAITSAALASLYIQILSVIVILFVYYTFGNPFVIHEPVAALGILLLAWFTGVAVGLVFLAAKPWSPGFVGVATTIFARANMIASGKMFVANALPPAMLAMFDWNPLFHCIDQMRGAVFINYNPHNSSIEYPIYASLALVMIGLMGEFYTRKHASASWNARR